LGKIRRELEVMEREMSKRKNFRNDLGERRRN